MSHPESVMGQFGKDEALSAPGDEGRTRASESTSPASAAESDDERQMAAWGITFEDGQYVFAAFRYERLADAVAYARLERSRFAV